MVTFASIPGKALEQVTEKSVCEHLEEDTVISKIQYGFLKNKSCKIILSLFLIVTIWQITVKVWMDWILIVFYKVSSGG